MAENTTIETDAGWKYFIRKHWTIFAVFTAIAIVAVVSAVYVFVWFTAEAQTSGLVPASLGMWSMNNLVLFILHAIFWELVLIGIPVALAALGGWLWWKNIPQTEKDQYHLESKKSSKGSRAGGAISPLLFIAFAIKVYIDGNWNVAIATYSLDYVVGSMVTILIWIAAIVAIPAVIGVAWWLHSGNKKP
jgi:hypothetical protein